ncbi:MAG: DUF4344 domain-containing metallopeptidase [Actinomycetota bacterium]|nr:DUF4344 domain-containing metallopeptidase [Actinomycetota bacterium]
MVAGCGGAQPDGAGAAPQAGPEESVVEVGDDDGDSGQMIVTYEDATSPEAINGRALMQDNELLEMLAADVNDSLWLPYDIPVIGAQCDEANAFWDPEEQSMTICYEDADLSQQIFVEAGDEDPDAAALNAEIATFYHELGHMAVDVYDLPATGREEDVADQLAAFVLLQPEEDGSPDADSVQAVKDFAREFGAYGQRRGEVGFDDFADVHSISETRMVNLQCWIYGADPDGNTDLIDTGELPEERADGCDDEWAKLDRAWSTLLEPYVK